MSLRLLAALAVALGVPLAARAQIEPRAAVYASASAFRPAGAYTDTEDPVVPGALALTAGAEAPVGRLGRLTVNAGAALRLASVRARPTVDGALDPAAAPYASGLRPQHLHLYGRAGNDAFDLAIGAVVDLGPDPVALDTVDLTPFFTSDAQHAVRFAFRGTHPAGALRLGGALDAVLTLPRTFAFDVPGGGPAAQVDYGDTASLRLGATYPAGPLEVGLDVLYTQMDAGLTTLDVPPPPGTGRRRLLSLVPRARYAPPGSRLRVEAALEATGGWYGEHTTYGVTLGGRNHARVRLPVRVGLRVAL